MFPTLDSHGYANRTQVNDDVSKVGRGGMVQVYLIFRGDFICKTLSEFVFI